MFADKECDSRPRIDPDPVSIGAMLIATMGVVLQIESNMQSRREAARQQRITQNAITVRLALDEINDAIVQFETFWHVFQRLGTNEVPTGKTAFGVLKKYLTEEEYDTYLNELDKVLDQIGSVNKAVQRILFADLELTNGDRDRLVRDCQSLRVACDRALFGGREASEIFENVGTILHQSAVLVRRLILATDPEPPLAF